MRFLMILLVLISGSAYAAESESNEWKFQITPYLWLPTIGGDLNYNVPPGFGGGGGGGGSAQVKAGPTDWLDLLNMALLVNGAARKGRFSIMTDLMYLNMSSDDNSRVKSVEDTITRPGTGEQIPISASLTLDSKTSMDGLVWSLAAGYTIAETKSISLDVLGGVRYFGQDVETKWNLTGDITTPGGDFLFPANGKLKDDTNLWDAIVGLRGEARLGDSKWAVPFYADIGTGDSEVTWQLMGGIQRGFGWGDLMLVYRHLEYDEGSSGLVQDFTFSGFALGARFRF